MTSPRDIVAFWELTLRFVRYKRNKNHIESDFRYDHREQREVLRRYEAVLSRTMGAMSTSTATTMIGEDDDGSAMATMGSGELVRTALALAKIANEVGRKRPRNAPRRRILFDVLVGKGSKRRVDIFRSMAEASVPFLPDMGPQDLSGLAYAYAIHGSAPPTLLADDGGGGGGTTLFDRIAGASIPILDDFDPRELSNLIWSFGEVGLSNPALFEEAADAVVALESLDGYRPRHICNMLLSFSKMGVADHRLFARVADHVLALDDLDGFAPSDLSNLVRSYAVMVSSWSGEEGNNNNAHRHHHPRLFKRVASHIVRRELDLDDMLCEFKPREIADLVWSYATAGVRSPKLFKMIAGRMMRLRSLHPYPAEACAEILWAYARAGEERPGLVSRVAEHAPSAVRRVFPTHGGHDDDDDDDDDDNFTSRESHRERWRGR